LILSELREGILKELRQPEGYIQLELTSFSSEERQQFERNRSSDEKPKACDRERK